MVLRCTGSAWELDYAIFLPSDAAHHSLPSPLMLFPHLVEGAATLLTRRNIQQYSARFCSFRQPEDVRLCMLHTHAATGCCINTYIFTILMVGYLFFFSAIYTQYLMRTVQTRKLRNVCKWIIKTFTWTFRLWCHTHVGHSGAAHFLCFGLRWLYIFTRVHLCRNQWFGPDFKGTRLSKGQKKLLYLLFLSALNHSQIKNTRTELEK